MKINAFATVALASAFAIPSVVLAQPEIELNTLSAQWLNPVPEGNALLNNGGSPITARWGGEGSQSGYDFAPIVTPLDIDFAGLTSYSFNLGTFTHQNFPIPAGTSITDIRLGVTLGFLGAAPASFTEFFDIMHFETPNSADPCADGGALGIGVNVAGCADRVSFMNPASAQVFEVGGTFYNLTLRGFSNSDTEFDGTNQFWTVEGQENLAYLWADINVTTDPSIVPEPATLALTMMGLLGLGGVARRRRNV